MPSSPLTCSKIGFPNGGNRYDGALHFDYKPGRTEGMEGVWESARANIEMYMMLAEKAAAFRADPRTQELMAKASIPELGQSTLAEGESFEDFLADRSAFEDFDAEAAGAANITSSSSTSTPCAI